MIDLTLTKLSITPCIIFIIMILMYKKEICDILTSRLTQYWGIISLLKGQLIAWFPFHTHHNCYHSNNIAHVI